MIDYLTLSDVQFIIEQQGFRLRDAALLESAVAQPQVSAFGLDAYRTLWDKAAALLRSIAANQSLVDGNKRLAWLSVNVFLELNEVRLLRADPVEAETFISTIDNKTDVAIIAEQLMSWTDHERSASHFPDPDAS